MLNKIDKRYLVILIPLAILLILAMRSYFIVYFGDEITLETVPFDPTDLFRGDYVELSYEIENVDESLVEWGSEHSKTDRYYNEDMFAVLKRDGDVHVIDFITGKEPETGVYLNCEVHGYGSGIQVEYNINRYFLKEGTGTELEEAARKGQLLGKVKVYKGRGILVEIIEDK